MHKPLACAIGVVAALAAGPSVAATDIMDVYVEARAADPELRAAEYRLRAERELTRQAFADFLPDISAGYRIDRGPFEQTRGELITDVDQDVDAWSVTLTQPLFNREIWERRKQAGAQVSQAQAEFTNTEQAFVLRVAERYFDVLSARDTLRFTEAEARALARQLEQAEQRFEVGLSAITDVHEARARYDDARARVIVAENDLHDAEEALWEITGREMGALMSLREELPLVRPEPDSPDAWVESAVQQNPALEARHHAADVTERQIGIERSGHYPTLSLEASHFDRKDNSAALFSSSSVGETYTVSLNVPLFSGFAVSSRVDRAGHNYSAALEDVEQERRRVMRETRDQYRAVIAGISEVEARRQARISAQSALEATEAGYEVGTRTIVDLLISQQQLFQAERDLAQARYDYLLATLRLKQAAGAISPQDLMRINALLTRIESAPDDVASM